MDIQAIIFGFSKEPDAKMRDILCTLRRRGYRLATNYDCIACDVFFERNESASRETLLSVARLLGVSPSECAVVESECERLIAAKTSGMTAIGAGEAATCVYADICLGNIGELTDIFV